PDDLIGGGPLVRRPVTDLSAAIESPAADGPVAAQRTAVQRPERDLHGAREADDRAGRGQLHVVASPELTELVGARAEDLPGAIEDAGVAATGGDPGDQVARRRRSAPAPDDAVAELPGVVLSPAVLGVDVHAAAVGRAEG